MLTHTSRVMTRMRAVWWTLASTFIVIGYALDGISEPGHHAGFILGGIALGLSFRGKEET